MTSLEYQKPKDQMNSKYKNLLIAILTVLSLAAIAFTADAQLAFNYSGNNGKSTYRVNNLSGEFEVEYEGKIELSDDDKDIISITSGGYFELSKSSFGASRKIKIESDRDGLTKRYFVGWSERDYEPEGSRWLAEVLPDLVRSTTIAAESRVNRIYGKGGAAALINELSLLKSDYVSNRYFELAFEKPLTDQDQAKALKVAGETVSSDHYLSQILTNYLKKFGVSSITVGNFISAADEISSDHYKTNLLMEVLDRKDLTSSLLNEVLHQASDIASDHYLSNLIIDVIKTQELSTSNVTKIINATEDIASDHYKYNVYNELFSRATLSTSDFKMALNSLSDINSDHYLSQVMSKLLEKNLNEEIVVDILRVAAHNISSDNYLSNVIRKVLEEQNLSDGVMKEVAAAIGTINSSHYACEIIKSASRNELSKPNVIALLNTAKTISSDHYLTESLTALARRVNELDDETKEAYRAAAKNISSDTYYGRAMKALEY